MTLKGETDYLLGVEMKLEALKKYKSSWIREMDINELANFIQKYLHDIQGVYLSSSIVSYLAYRILASKKWYKEGYKKK